MNDTCSVTWFLVMCFYLDFHSLKPECYKNLPTYFVWYNLVTLFIILSPFPSYGKIHSSPHCKSDSTLFPVVHRIYCKPGSMFLYFFIFSSEIRVYCRSGFSTLGIFSCRLHFGISPDREVPHSSHSVSVYLVFKTIFPLSLDSPLIFP